MTQSNPRLLGDVRVMAQKVGPALSEPVVLRGPHEAVLRMRRKNAHSIRARRIISNLEAEYRCAVDSCRHDSTLPCKPGRVHTGGQDFSSITTGRLREFLDPTGSSGTLHCIQLHATRDGGRKCPQATQRDINAEDAG